MKEVFLDDELAFLPVETDCLGVLSSTEVLIELFLVDLFSLQEVLFGDEAETTNRICLVFERLVATVMVLANEIGALATPGYFLLVHFLCARHELVTLTVSHCLSYY